MVWGREQIPFKPAADEFQGVPQGIAPTRKRAYVPRNTPPAKQFQVASFERIFHSYNPGSTLPNGWQDEIDSSLRIPENREGLARAFPTYNWYPSSQEEARGEIELDRQIQGQYEQYLNDEAAA